MVLRHLKDIRATIEQKSINKVKLLLEGPFNNKYAGRSPERILCLYSIRLVIIRLCVVCSTKLHSSSELYVKIPTKPIPLQISTQTFNNLESTKANPTLVLRRTMTNFSLDIPFQGDGEVAPGLCVSFDVSFLPLRRLDYEDSLVVRVADAQPLIIPVKAFYRRLLTAHNRTR